MSDKNYLTGSRYLVVKKYPGIVLSERRDNVSPVLQTTTASTVEHKLDMFNYDPQPGDTYQMDKNINKYVKI